MGTMMLMAGVCWCTYGGWNRDRDLQTGYSASGAAGDSMTRTVREFHQIDRNELVKSIKIKKTVKKDGQEVEVYISNGHGKGPNQVLQTQYLLFHQLPTRVLSHFESSCHHHHRIIFIIVQSSASSTTGIVMVLLSDVCLTMFDGLHVLLRLQGRLAGVVQTPRGQSPRLAKTPWTIGRCCREG